MESNVVKKSDFSASGVFQRLDAEYMSPSLVTLEVALRKLRGDFVSGMTVPYRGPTVNASFASEEDHVEYVAIDSVDIEDGLTYSEQILYRDRPSRAKYVLEPGDVLVSNVRPNRNAVSLVSKRCDGALASSGFTLLRPKSGGTPQSELLFAFLKTEYGRDQLMRRDRGSMYPAVLASDVLEAWIPSPPDEVAAKIVACVQMGTSLHDDFFKLLSDLDGSLAKFLKPLGAPPSPLETNRTDVDSTVVSSKAFFGEHGPQRIDAEFFRGEYESFDKKAQAFSKSFLLGEQYRLSPGRGLGTGEDDIPLIKQGVLTNAGVNWSALSIEAGKKTGSGRDVEVGDVLLACTAHEIYYGKRPDKCVVDRVTVSPESLAGGRSPRWRGRDGGVDAVQSRVRRRGAGPAAMRSAPWPPGAPAA